MLKIAVFDTADHAQQMEDLLVRLLFDKCEFGLEAYTAGDKLSKIDFGESFQFDIAFVEMNAGFFSGLEVAKRIREAGHIHTEIIFTAMDETYALHGYKFHGFDYLVKPIPIRQISETIDRYFSYYAADVGSSFSYKVSGAVQKIRHDDIFYFMSAGRKCTIVNKGEDTEFYAKLDEVEESLPADAFIRVHQSYIVNIKYIKTLTKEGVTMNNGLFVPISQKRYSIVKKKFMQYLEIEE